MEQRADSPPPISLDEQSESTFRNMAIVFHDACCDWSSSDEKELNMVLNHVTLDLPKGSFVAVIGEVKPVPEVFQNSAHPLLHI